MMVALNCEAKPWIDFYKLKKISDSPFSLFSKEGVNVDIVITGIGTFNMATAVGWIGGRDDSIKRVWLNLGIAGHLNRKIGEVVRVHSLIDSNDLRKVYLPLTARWPGELDALLSVNSPTDAYPDKAMIDMEGVAFYKAASLFNSTELVASVKVISDNQDNSVEGLNGAMITEIMRPHISVINEFGERLVALAEPVSLLSVSLPLDDVKMTHSQQRLLEDLLESASTLGLLESVAELALSKSSNADEVLGGIRSLIEGVAPAIKGAQRSKISLHQTSVEESNG